MNINDICKKNKYEILALKSTQDIIPVVSIDENGIMKVGYGLYSKSYKFLDINYQIASYDEKKKIFLNYSDFLNSFDDITAIKISIINQNRDKEQYKENIMLGEKIDKFNKYRQEYNEMLLNYLKDSNEIIQEKIITITVSKNNLQEAKSYFNRISSSLINKFNELGSKCIDLSSDDKKNIICKFYKNTGINENKKIKNELAPNKFEVYKDFYKSDYKFGRILYLKEYATYIKDSFITELTELNKNMILSIDLIPISMEVAIKEAENRRLGIETNITNWQKKQIENRNLGAVIPYDMEQARNESKEFLDDLVQRDQRMFLVLVTVMHQAKTKKALDEDTSILKSIANKNLCNLSILKYQQLDALNTVLPYGCRYINCLRTLTTESLAVLMPFKVKEIEHDKGITYGQNAISKNIIRVDRKKLVNGNGMITGVSGSGKSFAAKLEIVERKLKGEDCDIIIIDPEDEYGKLVKELNGEVIEISSTSSNHINALDINDEYGDGANPVILKSEFILSLCEQLIGDKNLGPKQKSIIDRCTTNVYRNCKKCKPTLKSFKQELLKQDEPEAKDIALALELFTDGSLNTFSEITNVNISNNLISYNIKNLGKQLQPIAMLVVLDSILNRITLNRNLGKATYIFIDEIYLLFQYEYSSTFLFNLWKRVRKYNACCIGITQNVDDLLQSHTARTMLANSEFLLLFNQAPTDKIEFKKLLNISDEELIYITNSRSGEGLIKVANSIVPFVSKLPIDTELYNLISTKPIKK